MQSRTLSARSIGTRFDWEIQAVGTLRFSASTASA
jgi:hypothetical protein